jgi:hypothetical protein
MSRSITLPRLLAAAVMAFALAACAGQKEPAQQSLTELDAAFAKVAEMGQKYMPEEYAEVDAQIAALKASFDQGDYGAVVAGASKAAAAIRKLQADSIIAKADFAKQMNAEWAEFSRTMPDTIIAVDKQITRSSSRLPKGMDRDTFKQVVATFDEAKKSWEAAAELGNAGKYEEAVMESRKVKDVVDATMAALGMSAG